MSTFPQPYYSPETQNLANQFASWMDIRNIQSSSGQTLLNAFGMNIQDFTRFVNAETEGLYLANANVNVSDILYKVIMPWGNPLTATPIVIGNGITLTQETDVDNFLYLDLPTRITQLQATTSSSLTFGDIMGYDIPWYDQYKQQYLLNYQYNTGTNQLMKWYPVLPTLDASTVVRPAGIDVIGSYNLFDINGNPIVGTYSGASMYLDNILMLFGNKVYLFDARIPLTQVATAGSGWYGNQEVTGINAMAEFSLTLPAGVTAKGISYDPRAIYFWIHGSDGNYYQYQLNYDYVLYDFSNNTAFFRESYSTLTVNGVSWSEQIHNVWNYFDEFGLFLGTSRLLGENNQKYQARLLTVMPFRANSTVQGVVDGVSRELALPYYGYFPSGVQAYPKNLFPTQEFPAGYPIYASGVYPSGVNNIAKINALFDPVFYSGFLNPLGVPNAEMVDYTKEILSTFPILWGSGSPTPTADPIGFVWDLAPFDGGLNYSNTIPNYFQYLDSGVPSEWFQSGAVDPTQEGLSVQIVSESGNWVPQIWNGDFYINNNLYHLYAVPGSEYIPAGANPYVVSGVANLQPGFPITVIDLDGTTAPSGTQYVHVSNFDNVTPYEFIYQSGLIEFSHPQNGLYLYYETNVSGWYTPPGFDFNPTHTGLPEGFLWISNEQQFINVSGYTLTVTPQQLYIGGGSSTLVGNLLDVNGNPVAGAIAYFSYLPSGFGTITNPERYTDLNGNAYSLYQSPNTIADFALPVVYASGSQIVVSGVITTTQSNDIWTVLYSADEGGAYASFRPVMWMADTDLLVPPRGPATLSIQPGDWQTVPVTDANYGTYTGYYVIGGPLLTNTLTGSFEPDDFFNIALSGVYENSGGIGGNTLIVQGSTNADGYGMDIDNYRDPQTFGKLIIYTVTIPVGPTVVGFDTYAPVQPTLGIQPNVPSAGLTTLSYPLNVPSSFDNVYEVYAPAAVQIQSWAVYEGVQTLTQNATINIDFPTSMKGVLQTDKKLLDFVSYIRTT